MVEIVGRKSTRGVSSSSLTGGDRGELVFEDNVSTPSRLSISLSLKEALALRISLVASALALYAVLLWMLVVGPLDLMGELLLMFAVTALLIIDSQYLSRDHHSAKPMEIYEKGTKMPITWFERRFLRKDFVPWDDVGTIFAVKHNVLENHKKILRGVETEIVLVTKDGVTYSSWIKDRKEVEKALRAISSLWPRLQTEMMRVERLGEMRVDFSKGFASVDPWSLLLPALVLDALYLASLGISIPTCADLSAALVIVSFIIAVDLVFGYLLARVGRARAELMSSLRDSEKRNRGT